MSEKKKRAPRAHSAVGVVAQARGFQRGTGGRNATRREREKRAARRCWMERREERSASPLSDFRSVCPQAGAARRPFDITKTSPPFLCLSSLGRLSQRERRADRFASTYYYGLLTRRALTPKVALTRLHVLPRIDATILSSPLPVRSILRPFFFFLLGATPRHAVDSQLCVAHHPSDAFSPPFFRGATTASNPFVLPLTPRVCAHAISRSGPPTSSAASEASSFFLPVTVCDTCVYVTHTVRSTRCSF